MREWLVRIAACIGWCAIFSCIPLQAAPAARPYTVEKYDVSIQIDLANRRLHGEAQIRLRGAGDMGISALEFDAAGLEILSVVEVQAKQSFEQNRTGLFIALTDPLQPDEQRTITVEYQADASAGLKFFDDQIVASDVSAWMPCNESAGEHAGLHLTIETAADMKTAATGRLVATRANADRTTTEWQLDSGTDPLRFGFVTGKFAEHTSDVDGIRVRVLGGDKSAAEPIAAALRFFADRTGKRYPAPVYTTAFTHADAVRSLAGLSFLPESSAKDVPLMASQLARQWFGMAIREKNRTDAWLSEGFSEFLADAFLAQRPGGEAFERAMAGVRENYYRLRSAGEDLPLADAADRDLARTKGAWFLYLIQQLTGENAFWNGVKLWTASSWDRAVTSEDAQRAFDGANSDNARATGKAAPRRTDPKALDKLFDTWVFGVSEEKQKSKSK